jgi:mono/diheme cytochrome c family protein
MPIAQLRSSLRSHLVLLAGLATLALTAATGRADEDEGDDPIGLTEYEIACMSCHGIDGKGNGPQAPTLSMMPADLTGIARANGGVFPARQIFDMIDGRGVIPAHGRRDMPIWGARYRATGEPGEDPAEVEKRVRLLIDALVNYIESIQAK